LRSCIGKRRIELSGKSVTLRTYAAGSADADYGVVTDTATASTIRAVQRMPGGEDQRTVDEAGEDLLIDMVFLVRDGDQPAITAGLERPQIDDPDSVTYEVRTVGPEKGGTRELLCRSVR
jgi:hypothetical protein